MPDYNLPLTGGPQQFIQGAVQSTNMDSNPNAAANQKTAGQQNTNRQLDNSQGKLKAEGEKGNQSENTDIKSTVKPEINKAIDQSGESIKDAVAPPPSADQGLLGALKNWTIRKVIDNEVQGYKDKGNSFIDGMNVPGQEGEKVKPQGSTERDGSPNPQRPGSQVAIPNAKDPGGPKGAKAPNVSGGPTPSTPSPTIPKVNPTPSVTVPKFQKPPSPKRPF